MKKILVLLFSCVLLISVTSCTEEPVVNESELSISKAEAIDELRVSDFNFSAYREAQQQEILNILQEALEKIESAKTLDEVLNTVSKALDDIQKIKTNASLLLEEIEAAKRAFANYKFEAKATLDMYIDSSNYYKAEEDDLFNIKSKAKANIDLANTYAEVDVIVNNAKLAMDAVLTKEQINNELGSTVEVAKITAKTIIEDYASLDNYREAEKILVTQAKNTTKNEIDAAATIDAVITALNKGKVAIFAIKTAAQYDLEDLELAKIDYKTEIGKYSAPDRYYPEQLGEINVLLQTALQAIDEAVNMEQLDEVYEAYEIMLQAIKTKDQIDNEDKDPDDGDDPDVPIETSGDLEIIESAGYNEGLFVEWTNVTGVDSYNVYYKGTSASNYIKVDKMLVRTYPSYSRVDIVGLSAGLYTVKIVCVKSGAETAESGEVSNLTVIPHVRAGYAFVNGTSSGAYNEDGTLKSNALVIYITEKTKNTVSVGINTGKKEETAVGWDAITNLIKKGAETRPIVFRLIGNITPMSVMQNGDIVISNKNNPAGITVEGIGNDTYANGWGIRIKDASNVEVRNIGFMLTNSGEKDNLGLQQKNDHIWVHNSDFFYGKAGGASDQAKGDGALDTKKSMYVTHSYNHFWDVGKTHLNGNKESITEQNFITYVGNWYDHSDSRHPRVRIATVHVYNNLFDGISKYGIGATMGSSIFAEGNVFKNTNRPIMSSRQGTDTKDEGTFSGEAGGMVKAYDNLSIGTTSKIIPSTESPSFDAYIASTRDEKVPSSVVTLVGKTTYNNFDTESSFYKYSVLPSTQVETHVKSNSGRVQGGDFTWEFTDADNLDYDLNKPLMNKLLAYKTSIVRIGDGNEVGFTPASRLASPKLVNVAVYSNTTTFAAKLNFNGNIAIPLAEMERKLKK